MLTLFVILIAACLLLAAPAIVVVIIVAIVKSQKKKELTVVESQPKPPREKLSASAVMLLIGTAFILLAAITFVVANWVKMDELGRVFALFAESALAFGISALLKKVIKLNRTSISFYMIGTIVAVISFITGAYYELFGDWLAVHGDGWYTLYAVSALAIAAASFAAKPIYESKAFDYIGTSFVSLAIIWICGQPFHGYEGFSVTIAFAQLAMTAIIHFLKPQKDTEMERPVVLIGDISAVLYQALAFIYVLKSTAEPTIETFFILTILLAQLLIYGIFKNKKWLFIFFNLVGLYTAMIVSILSEETLGSEGSALLFAFMTAAFFVANRLIPKNLVSCHVVTLIGVIIGSIVSFNSATEKNYMACLIVPALAAMGVASYSLNRNKSIQTASGLFAPVIPFFMAMFFEDKFSLYSSVLSDESTVFSYGILALVYILAAAFFVYLPKINFNLHANYPLKSEVIIYTNMIFAASVLLNISRYSQLFMIPVVLCIAHFVVSYSMRCNITAAGSVVSLIILVNSVIRNTIDSEDAGMYIMLAIFVVLIIISRVLFPEGFTFRTEDNKLRIDVILLSSWTAIVSFIFQDMTSFSVGLIAIAVFIAGFIKKNTPEDKACTLLTISSTIACFAFMIRPFLVPDSSMIASKINIGIFALLGASYRLIWKNHPNGAKTVSTIIFIISFASLIIDGIVFSSVANRIFVLVVTAGILVLSFFVKSKTWFTASSIALVIITIFSTYRYFNSAGWWLYLLIVGVIFITIASINEVCKKNGESMKSTFAKRFSDWKW